MAATYLPTRTTDPITSAATIALDLSSLGAPGADRDFASGLPAEHSNLVRLAAYARTANQSGVSFVGLGEAFRLRSGSAPRANSWLDPIIAARRISPSAGGTGLVPSVQLGRADAAVAAELAQFNRKSGAWAGLQVTTSRPERAAEAATPELPSLGDLLEDLVRSTSRGRRSGGAGAERPKVVLPLSGEADVDVAGEFADVVRLREADLTWARELRYAVRSATRAAGRTPAEVLVDLRAIISADYPAARARADLLADLAGGQQDWSGALETVGTVGDVVTTIERWLDAGAADGFVVLPGSVPADVAGLLRGVIPALRARGLLRTEAATGH